MSMTLIYHCAMEGTQMCVHKFILFGCIIILVYLLFSLIVNHLTIELTDDYLKMFIVIIFIM